MRSKVLCTDCKYCPLNCSSSGNCLKDGKLCFLTCSGKCDDYIPTKKSQIKIYVPSTTDTIQAIEFTKDNFLECIDFIGRNNCIEGTCENDNIIHFDNNQTIHIVDLYSFILKKIKTNEIWSCSYFYFKEHYMEVI